MTKYILIRESVLQSIIKDVVSLGLLFLLSYLNAKYLDKSFLINIIVFVCFSAYVAGFTSRKKQLTSEEAIGKLQQYKKEDVL